MTQQQKKAFLENIGFDEGQLCRASNGIYNRYIKRLLDFFLASFALVFLLPVLLIISIVIVIDSGFPILYLANRGGYRGKNFRICKFRSMVKNADKIGGGTTALNDRRITRVGKVLRKTKLDELPQLFNIIGGSMSFIGPRPELTQYTDLYDHIEKYILAVRPGITDFSSIEFINLDEIVGEQNADEFYEKYIYKRKNYLRLKYVSEISFWTDCHLFFDTLFHVLKKNVHVLHVLFVKR